MTKKHFDAIITALQETRPPRPPQSAPLLVDRHWQWNLDCEAIADVCAKFNPKFDRARFLGACEGK